MAERVTICIPAYKAEAFLAETLDSALAQTYPAIDIVISVDPGGDGTARVARQFATHRQWRVIEQPKRLGWIGNTNFVLGQARSHYVMILPHDDILAPDYVEATLDGLRAHPDAVICFPEMDVIGNDASVAQGSATGPHHERLCEVLRHHYNAVAFRGIFDRRKAPKHLIPNAIAGYAADTLWFTQLACQGELIRIPGVRYHKRMLASAAHAGWERGNADERHEMWAVHCLEMIRTILEASPPFDWTDALQAAWTARLSINPLHNVPNPRFNDRSKSPVEHVSDIVDEVRARPIPYSWVKS